MHYVWKLWPFILSFDNFLVHIRTYVPIAGDLKGRDK